MIVIALVAAVVLLALAIVFGSAWLLKLHSREMLRAWAQADAHLKIGLTNADKAISRYMAAKTPGSFDAYREKSGTVDGAQAASERHYEDEPAPRKPSKNGSAPAPVAERPMRMPELPTSSLDFERAPEGG